MRQRQANKLVVLATLLMGLAPVAGARAFAGTSEVTVTNIDADTLHDLRVGTSGGKLRLIAIWATWCAPCVAELSELDAIQHDLGSSQFEVVTVSIDPAEKAGEVSRVLKRAGAQTRNYLYVGTAVALAETIGPIWAGGALPFVFVVTPSGQLLHSSAGTLESDQVRAKIRQWLTDRSAAQRKARKNHQRGSGRSRSALSGGVDQNRVSEGGCRVRFIGGLFATKPLTGFARTILVG